MKTTMRRYNPSNTNLKIYIDRFIRASPDLQVSRKCRFQVNILNKAEQNLVGFYLYFPNFSVCEVSNQKLIHSSACYDSEQ